MRAYYCCLLLWTVASSQLVARAAEPPAPDATAPKQILKPDAFETLVNPNCSHCVDEARRRAGQLRDDDRVLAWIRGKYEGGAVPWRFFLVPYRVISDTYGVFVYDADAGYVRGYEPSLDFRFAGWRNGVMVLRHKDGTLYSALSGRAFDGPRRGEQLKPVATLETDWGFWSKAYPGSVAYHMFDKYQPMELPRRESADSIQTRQDENPRQTDGQTRVIGLALEGKSKAWPLAALEAAGGLIEDTLAGQKLVVLWYPPTQTAAIYAPEVEGAGSPQPLSLARDGEWQHAAFHDRQTGSRWGIEGRALEGALKGKTLRWLPGVQCRWFAWAAEYPETELHAGPQDIAAPAASAARDTSSQTVKPVESPLSAVIVGPEAVTGKQAGAWRRDGYQPVVVLLDEQSLGTHDDWRRRFAAALLHDPTVLVIDEPLVGLDPRSSKLMKDLLRARAAAGVAVFMSTHLLDVAEQIADRIGIVDRCEGMLAELRGRLAARHTSLEQLFLDFTSGGGAERLAAGAANELASNGVSTTNV